MRKASICGSTTIQGFQAGTPDFSGKLAKPVLVRVVAKQLFYGTGTPLAEIPGLHSQNMRDKPCRIVSAAGNFACDLFRQNFRGFRLTTPLFASHTRSSTSMRSWRGWNWGDGNFGGSGLQPQPAPQHRRECCSTSRTSAHACGKAIGRKRHSDAAASPAG